MTEALVRLTDADFFSGIFFALIAKGEKRFPSMGDRSLHKAFVMLFDNELQEEAVNNGLDIRFCLKLERLHGVSETVQHEISGCILRGILTIELHGALLPRFTEDMAEKALKRLPGTPDMYKRLAASFEAHLRGGQY